ncbi:hypothetical protein CTAYLR_008819 [Chrysophaeum taylorii]|uniref:Uncharacterized protein n=1 Tax=Chrysophaeum taylorii TaxID=2483200 RepID=A0AAD7UCF3_9STRA|nr:hypothetical protein CTAYLR_008819 [Chrysophaeum taylorii]
MLEQMQATMNKAIASGLSVPASAPPQKACVLDKALLDLNQIREDNRLELIELLESVPGSKKCLILDPQLGGRLNHVLVEGARVLRENGVVAFRELRAEIEDDFEQYVYLCRAYPPHMFAIAKHVKASVRAGKTDKRFHVFMIPRKTFICEQFLEDELVLPYVNTGDFHLDLVAFDADVLSLELESCFHDTKIRGDPTMLEFVVQSLLKLENFFGVPRRIRGLGPSAKGVLERLARQRHKMWVLKLRERGCYMFTGELLGAKPPPPMPAEDPEGDWELMVFDRAADLVTALVTPLTYEGLIDELVGIKNSCVKLPDQDGGSVETVALNSNDALYQEIRDLNVEGLGSTLGDRAKQIRGSYDNFRSNKDASITEIHDFVKQIPGLTRNYKSLQTHINIVEKIKETTDSRDFRDRWNTERSMLEGEQSADLEDLILQQIPPMMALRFLCLQSIVAGGIRKFDFFRREIIHSYGFELLPTLHNLEKAGLLTKKDSSWMTTEVPFATVRKQLRLIVDVDAINPDDISYVSSGYAPLSCRLLQVPWTPQLLQHLPGPAFDYRPFDFKREDLVDLMKTPSSRLFSPPTATEAPLSPGGGGGGGGGGSPAASPQKKKTTLVVYFVGGVTYAEIAALRFLSKQPAFPHNIIVATTNIVNGSTFIKGLVYEIENRLQRNNNNNTTTTTTTAAAAAAAAPSPSSSSSPT